MRRITLPILALAAACQSEAPPGNDYFDRVILPILNNSCSQGTSFCHRADPSDLFAFAAGNFDTTSFENVKKRPDLLRQFGAYPVPFLLLKAVGPTQDLKIVYRGQTLPSQIPHAGGPILRVGTPAYLTLQQWLSNGATIDGQRPVPAPVLGNGPCSGDVPVDFVPSTVTTTPQWAMYSGMFDGVQALMNAKGCNSGTCHGAPQSDFYITCGADDTQKAYNFWKVWAFSATRPEDSEIISRPVAGVASHTGGAFFSAGDSDYNTLKAFIMAVGELPFAPGDANRLFFADRVMPVLLQRGCAAEGCHSGVAMNDFKLRSGGQGWFSLVALEKNYRLFKNEFMALEVPDIRRSRVVAKNIPEPKGGIRHRGGPLLEGSSDDAAYQCTASYDPATSSAYCTVAEWVRLERQAMGNPNPGNTVRVVYVERQATHTAPLQDFATYEGGSDLKVVTLTLGTPVTAGAATSILGSCGASTATADIRAPDVKNDGATVAFAMRKDAGDTLHIYTVGIDGSGCTPITNGAGVFDLDPAWSPDGAWIVFASSRAGGTTKRLNLPQSDLWRMHADGSAPERMTFLSNSELGPQFMRDGRVSMTTEKVDIEDATAGFYQLSGRRLNWDLTDYHPLLGQRAQSLVEPANPGSDVRDSVGFAQATEIHEGLDGDFVLVFGPAVARGGGGVIGIFNRSVGPFERGRNDPGYLAAVTYLDPGTGAYRSPIPLPDGHILASFAAGPVDLGNATSLPFKLSAVDVFGTTRGARTDLGIAGASQVEPALALVYPPRPFYINQRQLVFGGEVGSDPTHATVYFPDAPMVATLLGSNLRRGRHVEDFDVDGLAVYGADGNMVGSVPLQTDGSVRIRVPAATPVYLGLLKGQTSVFRMKEEHQLGPGESISLGIRRELFNNVCGGCHGSNSGREIDAAVKSDALTGASESMSRTASPISIGP